MFETLLWWLLLELIGIAVLPIAYRFFRDLPDRGYAFIKPLGLLLIAYPFWLLTTLGFLSNTRGAVLGVGILVAGCAWYFGLRRERSRDTSQITESPVTNPLRFPIRSAQGLRASGTLRSYRLLDWLKKNKPVVIATELVFTIAFFAWTFVRSYMPDITATEKPMEFAFLNGILQSDHFPPRDPWLAGYAISYYYFGYTIVAMLTVLSGVLPSIAFNLAIALLFALSATGSYGLAYNLIQNHKLQHANDESSTRNPESLTYNLSIPKSPVPNLQSLFFPLFAAIFLVLIGNLEGYFESLHSVGWGSPDFWNWLDVKQLAEVPVTVSLAPSDNWWWWRASRVVHDVVRGQTQEVIDEFPQFSFLLGDMHPHVLALPFALLALAAALNLLNSKFATQNSDSNGKFWDRGFGIFDFSLLPLILGGLFFFNTWDILPYGFILVAAFAIARYRVGSKWDARATGDLSFFVIALGILSVVLYFPFYLGFQSQAGGILPVLFVKTRLHQYLVMFGLFVFILGVFLLRLLAERREALRDGFARVAPIAAMFFGFPILVALIALGAVLAVPSVRDSVAIVFGASDNAATAVFTSFFGPLLNDPWLFLLLALILTATLVLLRTAPPALGTTTVFVLLLAFTGFLLTYAVEFVYLRDQFASRMNTVFKFYFQAWTLFSVAGGYAVYYLSQKLNGIVRVGWYLILALLLAASLVYPTLAIPSRAEAFKGEPTLDGLQWIRRFNRGDYDAIQWLRDHAPRGSAIVEAVGDAYSYGNRISMATGLPTPLGWVNHENQWRGSTKLFKDDVAGIDREADVRRIYQSLDAQETLTLLAKYDIKFLIVGGMEKTKYGLTSAQVNKFNRLLTLVFESGDVRIYAR